jgi:hypothetical protein
MGLDLGARDIDGFPSTQAGAQLSLSHRRLGTEPL